MRQKLDCLSFTLIGSDCWAVRCQCWSRQECQSGYLRNGRTGRRFLGLEATAWWSWSDSNQQPKCYGTLVGVRPTPLGRTPIQDAGCFVVLRDYPGVLRRAAHVGRLFISVRLCGNDIRLGPPFSDFLWPEIPFSRKQRNRLRRLWPQDEMLPILFGGTGQKCAHPPIRADGVNMRQVRGFGVGEPI